MSIIALLLTVAATAQPPYPDEPPALDEGEFSYAIDSEGQILYVRARGQLGALDKEGYFESDEPVEKFSGWRTLSFDSSDAERNREERWRKQVEALNIAAGFVRAEFADQSQGWVREDVNRMSEMARAAAVAVIEEREHREAIEIDSPSAVSAEAGAEASEGPGFLALWGPQIAVAGIALVLMGIVVRVFFLPDGAGWEKID